MIMRSIVFVAGISSCAFAMNGTKLSENQLLSIIQATAIAQAVIEDLQKQFNIMAPMTPATIAMEIGQMVVDRARPGKEFTESDLRAIISGGIKNHFKQISQTTIEEYVKNEMQAVKGGNSRILKSKNLPR